MLKPRKRSDILKHKLQEAQKHEDEKGQAQKKHHEILKQAINEVAGSDSGRLVLRELARICWFGRSKVAADAVARLVDEKTTTQYCMQENIYLHFRKFIRREHKIKIEYPLETED